MTADLANIPALKMDPNAYGIIHADLGCSNILLTEQGLVPIDFSLCGYGCFAQEIGMILSNYNDSALYRLVFDGAARGNEITNDEDAMLFLSLSVLLFIAAQHKRFHIENWFKGSMVRWCKEIFVHGAKA